MHRFTSAVRSSIKERNWYSALIAALILPDVCGCLEDPKKKSQARYSDWWDAYLKKTYTMKQGHVFLSGGDAYALRCACLHEGSDDITEQRAREMLAKFAFIEPPAAGSIHCNQKGSTLQLQVDRFCEDICAGVEQWVADVKDKAEVQERINSMLLVKTSAEFLKNF
jgi:hypothetical protein